MADEKKRQYETSEQDSEAKRKRPAVVDDEVSTMKIDDINIDCLEHVFNYLSLMDLINVADANKYLRRAAALVFACRSKGKMVMIMSTYFHIPALQPLKLTDESIVIQKLKPVFRILRHFGELMSKIKMEGHNDPKQRDKELLIYVNEYCSEALNSLAITYGPDFTYANTMKPYKNVEEVSIELATIGFGLSQFKKIFPKLRRLELVFNNFANHRSFASEFHQLKHLKISFSYLLQKSDLKNIIRLNPQLLSVSIGGSTFGSQFWAYVSTQLKHLRELELNYDQDKDKRYNGEPIRFESVEILKLNLYNDVLKTGQILSFKQLKECTINRCFDFSWIDIVINNPTIEKLNLIQRTDNLYITIDEEDMIKIATSLPALTELSMFGWTYTVNTVIRFLNESQSLRRFSMTVFNDEDFDDLPSIVTLTPEWNAIKHSESIVFERK